MLIIPPMPWMMIVVAGALGVRPVLAEAGDRRVDQSRIGGAQGFGVEAELLEAADLEILDDDVASRRQPADQRRAFGPREVDRRRSLAAVGG